MVRAWVCRAMAKPFQAGYRMTMSVRLYHTAAAMLFAAHVLLSARHVAAQHPVKNPRLRNPWG